MRSPSLERIGLTRHLPHPGHAAAFILASSSIGSLLLYFTGWMSMRAAVWCLLVPATVLLLPLALWARGARRDLYDRIALGFWAGSFATLAYDLVRVPLAHTGLPVFKAISYFGTVILGTPHPTLMSEITGWAYHFSNGVGFAIMYTLLVARPGWLSAIVWGVLLEAVMWMTPYAEIFGYRRSATFLAITVGAHVVYGLGLWLSARWLMSRERPGPTPARLAIWMAGPICLALIAWDFHQLHARTIPASPPPYIGPNLYVTWNAPEPDRIGALWLLKRWVNAAASFHFVEPMSQVSFGTPFDFPEAEIRRDTDRSTFEVILARTGREDDPALKTLARMCHMTEIRPWALASDPDSEKLASDLQNRLGDCRALTDCLDAGMGWFEETYERLSREARSDR